MFKKYSNKKYITPVAVAAAALAIVAALVGYEKACQEQARAQELALKGKLQDRTRQNRIQKAAVRKLIKVDIQQPFAQRFPAYRHSKWVYNQVTPKKRSVRNSGFDDLERLALESQADFIKPDTKKTKSEPDTARTASSYNSGYNSNYNNPYNSQAYNPPASSMASTSSWSGAPVAARQHAQTPRSLPAGRAHAPTPAHRSAPAVHEHAHHDFGAGQSRPSIAEPAKTEQAESKPVIKKTEDKKDKEPQREFNPSAAKPKPTRPRRATTVSGEALAKTEGPAQPTLEEILNNRVQSGDITDSEQELSQDQITEQSFTDKFKAGVQSLVELLVTVSMVKNGWDYVKQACDWLESTFGIGKWVRSLVSSGPQEGAGAQGAAPISVEPETQAVLQEPVVLPAETQTTDNATQLSNPEPISSEQQNLE